jgi:hypothetical protein
MKPLNQRAAGRKADGKICKPFNKTRLAEKMPFAKRTAGK